MKNELSSLSSQFLNKENEVKMIKENELKLQR